METFELKVRKRPTYEVGKKMFKTKACAIRYLAWMKVYERFGNLIEITEVNGLKCTCDKHNLIPSKHGEVPYSEDCPIHDRYRGYFRQLAQRIERAIRDGKTENEYFFLDLIKEEE
jgi:hypothetical protein